MRFASIVVDGVAHAAVVHPTKGVALVADLLPGFTGAGFRPVEQVAFTAPYRHPRRIWGIGLNVVGRMRFSSEFLVSFHSKVMPLFPGDITSTGTPGAVVISPGDVAECRVSGLEPLVNPVVARSTP